MPNLEKKSIMNGVDDLIDSALGLNHKLKKSCRILSDRPIEGFDASNLIENIYGRVVDNWTAVKSHGKSEENWRFRKQTRISGKNRSPEVQLERAIVNIPAAIWPDATCWVNQVPVASGFVDPHADGSRRIDLVHKCGNKAYEFIELKIGSDTPLYAAMEILKYGVIYILCRQHGKESPDKYSHETENLLVADMVHLRVLAPAKYYEEYDLSWLENSIDQGLTKFLAQHGFEMDFKFESLWLIPTFSPARWRVKTTRRIKANGRVFE